MHALVQPQYWVDPNAGDPKDAILVYCDMEAESGPATCIQPKPSTSEEMAVETSEREMWFSDMTANGGFALTYKADSNQITFLQMLSSRQVSVNHDKKDDLELSLLF